MDTLSFVTSLLRFKIYCLLAILFKFYHLTLFYYQHLSNNNKVFNVSYFMQLSMFYFYLRTELNIIHPFQATKEFVGFHWVSFMSDVSIIKHPPAAAWQLTAAKQGSNILGFLPSFHPHATCNLSRRDSNEWWKQLFSLQFSPDNELYIRSSMCWPAATTWPSCCWCRPAQWSPAKLNL